MSCLADAIDTMPSAGFGDAEAAMTPLQLLRAEAQNMKLDMTDALESYAGSGYEKNMGVMDHNRFRSTLGTLFKGVARLHARLAQDFVARLLQTTTKAAG